MITSSGRVALLALALSANALQPEAPKGSAPFNGRLYAAVSRWEPADLDAARDGAQVSPLVRARFTRFVRCVSTFRSRLPEARDFFADSARPHQSVLERTLACSSNTPNASAVAAEYVARATILYEWEGLHTSPLEEAAYAERFILEHPKSPLLPSLDLFVAARMRHAFELLDGSATDSEMVSLAERYVTALDRARLADPLVGLIASDLDGLPFVYKDVGKHPRDLLVRRHKPANIRLQPSAAGAILSRRG